MIEFYTEGEILFIGSCSYDTREITRYTILSRIKFHIPSSIKARGKLFIKNYTGSFVNYIKDKEFEIHV